MPETGQNLLHYSLMEKIGKGGMGEVFKAKDLKLGRDVAIKVLPEEFARDTDRVARFRREAKLLASLNHPNIAAIHGLEEAKGINFLVLELVEGDTLADRIKAGPILVEESLKLAIQIAEALEAAHEKGVIHRDLKPANIKVTPDGKVKVLDFGLAKAFAGEQADLNLSNSPTLSEAATMQGVILGTAAYMSPEQARGKEADRRADIWGFGCVLFEMLTGRAAFSGKDVTDILAGVIRADPDWNSLPPNLHWRIREVIQRCLEKEPRDRYSGVNDARVDIRKALEDAGGLSAHKGSALPSVKRRMALPWVAAAAAVMAAILAGSAVWHIRAPRPPQVVRFDYELPEGQQLAAPALASLAVSPDGSRFVYCTVEGLRLRPVSEYSSRLIPGTELAMEPCFSPDGEWICYWSAKDSQIKKIAVSGGAPVSLTKTGSYPYGSLAWGEDDRIVYAIQGAIMRISANGGNPETLLKEEGICIAPQILPGGKSVLFTAGTALFKIIAKSIESGERKELFAGDTARYVSTGHIVYSLDNNLFAIGFDPDRLKVAGGPVSLVEGIFRTTAPQYALSDSGTLIYVPGMSGAGGPGRTLVWVDRMGKEAPLPAEPKDYRTPKISPDGRKVALTIYTEGKPDIWIWDLVRETMTRLTFDDANYPLWTLDGSRIVFSQSSAGVFWKAADGTGSVEKLGSVPDRLILPWSWSRDGKTLALFELPGGATYDIGTLAMDSGHEWKPLLNQSYIEFQPKISPDGKWMAYASNESGELEIYVRPFPDVNKGRWQVSVNGGGTPLWSPGGRELFYLNGDSVMTVPVESEPSFRPGKPAVLFRGAYVRLSTSDRQPWDISPDGKRFLMMKEAGASSSAASGPRKINVVLNWFEELKQRVPAK